MKVYRVGKTSRAQSSKKIDRILETVIQQGPRERSPRSVLEYVRRLSD